jgi:hypothetical protein
MRHPGRCEHDADARGGAARSHKVRALAWRPGHAGRELITVGQLRRGPSVIIPPSFSFVWRIPVLVVTTSDSDE